MHTTDTGASQTAMEEAKSCLAVLESWEGLWPGARKCKELLDDLAGTAAEAIKAMSNGQVRPSASQSSSAAVVDTPRIPSHSPSRVPDRRSSLIGVPSAMKSSTHQGRRNRSREVRISPHQVPSFRHDRMFLFYIVASRQFVLIHSFTAISQRARSTSRKRPMHDDGFEELTHNASLATVLSSSYPGRSALSSHTAHPFPLTVILHRHRLCWNTLRNLVLISFQRVPMPSTSRSLQLCNCQPRRRTSITTSLCRRVRRTRDGTVTRPQQLAASTITTLRQRQRRSILHISTSARPPMTFL